MCAIVGSDNKKKWSTSGLENLHAYSVISCHSDNEVWLLKVRNPWGYGEWRGKWSDWDEINWTEELKSKFGFCKKDDGIFFISIEDYIREYESTTVCFVDDTK